MQGIHVRVAANIRPTESVDKVRAALLLLFPGADVQEEPGRLIASTSDLSGLRQRIWELRIIDTFRGQFLHGMDEARGVSRFRLSKQAAVAGKVSFPARPHVLGELEVEVRAERDSALSIEQVGWWLAPQTKDGEVVGVPGVKPAELE